MVKTDLFVRAKECLMATVVLDKLNLTAKLYTDWQDSKLEHSNVSKLDTVDCGMSDKPELVSLKQLKPRNIRTPEGHAALIHSIAHIEFSAINLALDAVARFSQMPKDYYTDWIRIADEERQHFELLENRLNDLGFSYGDFPAHKGLWRVATETAHDILLRMALVPRVLEARGLDVTPSIIKKFEKIQDYKTVEILHRIFKDEITHVAVGSKWFLYLCKQRDLQPELTFIKIIKEEFKGNIQGPITRDARIKAGFSQFELDEIQKLA